MIVMGTHGASGFEHLVLGSVTEKVLRRARCPVLTAPPRLHAAAALPFQRILCAIDFSDSSLSGLEWAWSLAEEAGATVSLLHVIEWPWDEPPAPPFEKLPGTLRDASSSNSGTPPRSRHGSCSSRSSRTTCVTAVRPRHWSDTARLICEVLAPTGRLARADLIVMGVHGRNAVDMTLFGSTTNQVVRRASCPVLTVRTPR